MLSKNYVFYQKNGGYHDHIAVREYMYNALSIMLKPELKPVLFDKNSAIEDVIRDVSFGSFGRLLFPVDKNYYSGSTLSDLKLAWYNNINPDKTVEIVNYLKKESAKRKVFYDIYTEKEKKKEDSSKANTGLFFFKRTENEKFAICNAGGGMVYVGAMHDSFPHALELSKKGYNASY